MNKSNSAEKNQKVFYNIFLLETSGDKYLIAQTSDPWKFAEMEYPQLPFDTEDELDDGGTILLWQVSVPEDTIETEPSLLAIPVRDIRLNNTLLSEVNYNKFRKW